MKIFKIRLTAEFTLPDEFEVAKDPTDGITALKRGNKYYYPTFEWMERHLEIEPVDTSSYESAPSAAWKSVDDETADEFFEASLAKDRQSTEDYQIKQA
jgi:hypothetical protein